MIRRHPGAAAVLASLLTLVGVPRAAAQTVTPKGGPATLDMATWNVEWFGSTSNGPGNDAQQAANVRAVIEQSEIDLWALQEISDQTAFSNLLADLGPDYDGTLATNSGQQRIGFIWKEEVVSLRSVTHILESFEFEFAFRPPLRIEVDVTYGDTTFVLTAIVLHMKASSDLSSYERRVDAAQALKNHIDFGLLASKPVVVLGDFNDLVDGSITSGRESPFRPFMDDPEDYSIVSAPLQADGRCTFIGFNPCSTIDHIMVTNELFAEVIESSVDHYDELTSEIEFYSVTTSDHLPVFARLTSAGSVATERFDTPDGAVRIAGLYPTPVRDMATVTLRRDPADPARLALYDVRGRLVRHAFIPPTAGALTEVESWQLDAGGLGAGWYVLTIVTPQGAARHPFVVVR